MKIKAGYVVRTIAKETVVVPVGVEAVNFNGIITLNKTGKALWEQLTTEKTAEELVVFLTANYEVDLAIAQKDVAEFIAKLQKNNILATHE
jgi:hypothetical protein